MGFLQVDIYFQEEMTLEHAIDKLEKALVVELRARVSVEDAKEILAKVASGKVKSKVVIRPRPRREDDGAKQKKVGFGKIPGDRTFPDGTQDNQAELKLDRPLCPD